MQTKKNAHNPLFAKTKRKIDDFSKMANVKAPTHALSTWGNKNTNFAYVAQFKGGVYIITRTYFTMNTTTPCNKKREKRCLQRFPNVARWPRPCP